MDMKISWIMVSVTLNSVLRNDLPDEGGLIRGLFVVRVDM